MNTVAAGLWADQEGEFGAISNIIDVVLKKKEVYRLCLSEPDDARRRTVLFALNKQA